MSIAKWEAWPKKNRDGSRDRLRRWMVVDVSAPGTGKPVIADNIRTEQVAREIAALRPGEPG
jgi:hypothetical protein